MGKNLEKTSGKIWRGAGSVTKSARISKAVVAGYGTWNLLFGPCSPTRRAHMPKSIKSKPPEPEF